MNRFNVCFGDMFMFTAGKKNIFLQVVDDSGWDYVVVREVRTTKNEDKDKEFPKRFDYIPKGQELVVKPYSKLYLTKMNGRVCVELFAEKESKLCKRYKAKFGDYYAILLTEEEVFECYWEVPTICL